MVQNWQRYEKEKSTHRDQIASIHTEITKLHIYSEKCHLKTQWDTVSQACHWIKLKVLKEII